MYKRQHITNVAIHPDYRGRKLGEKLMRALIQLAADTSLSWMTLEVRRSNAVAQSLYRKLGFIDVGYRKRYYACLLYTSAQHRGDQRAAR